MPAPRGLSKDLSVQKYQRKVEHQHWGDQTVKAGHFYMKKFTFIQVQMSFKNGLFPSLVLKGPCSFFQFIIMEGRQLYQSACSKNRHCYEVSNKQFQQETSQSDNLFPRRKLDAKNVLRQDSSSIRKNSKRKVKNMKKQFSPEEQRGEKEPLETLSKKNRKKSKRKIVPRQDSSSEQQKEHQVVKQQVEMSELPMDNDQSVNGQLKKSMAIKKQRFLEVSKIWNSEHSYFLKKFYRETTDFRQIYDKFCLRFAKNRESWSEKSLERMFISILNDSLQLLSILIYQEKYKKIPSMTLLKREVVQKIYRHPSGLDIRFRLLNLLENKSTVLEINDLVMKINELARREREERK